MDFEIELPFSDSSLSPSVFLSLIVLEAILFKMLAMKKKMRAMTLGVKP